MTFSNTSYDKWKWVALTVLPALATLWLAIATTWGLAYGPEIAATLTAVDTFLGVILGISSKNYTPDTDGTIHVTDSGEAYASFATDPASLADKGKATVEVKHI